MHTMHGLKYSTIKYPDEIKRDLRKLMWERVGIIRCADSLEEAKLKLLSWKKITTEYYLLINELELKNMITVASIIVESALRRKGSIGAHYRSDYKERGKDWYKPIIWNKNNFRFEAEDLEPIFNSKC